MVRPGVDPEGAGMSIDQAVRPPAIDPDTRTRVLEARGLRPTLAAGAVVIGTGKANPLLPMPKARMIDQPPVKARRTARKTCRRQQ